MKCCERLTKREWLILSALGFVNFANTFCGSIQGPLYPPEAEKKGATVTEYGLVFGAYDAVAFISSPIFGKYIGTLGVKLMVIGGVVATGVSSLLFGSLSLIDSHTWFISLSYIVRILESLGIAASRTASFSITAIVFPETLATVFATLEIFNGLGSMSGPIIGGYLFEIGGFLFTFMCFGGLILIFGLLVFLILPNVEDRSHTAEGSIEILPVLKVTPVLLDAYCVTATSISMGFYAATLEPHLRQFKLSPVSTGFVFVISSTIYMVTVPLVGRLCDTHVNPKKFIIAGSIMVIISSLVVGPAPFMPFDTTLWVVCVGLACHGLGYSCLLVSSYLDAIFSAESAGFPAGIKTYGVVSGIMNSSLSLGNSIGPAVAGLLYNTVGFQKGLLFVIALHGVLFVGMTWYVCTEPRPRRLTYLNSTQLCGWQEMHRDGERLPLTSHHHLLQ